MMKSARRAPPFLRVSVSTALTPSSSVTTWATNRARLTGPSTRTPATIRGPRSEEHTSELQSQSNLVCRLLLEKKQDQHRGTALHRHERAPGPLVMLTQLRGSPFPPAHPLALARRRMRHRDGGSRRLFESRAVN